jgi:hypothetical protein
MIKKIAKKIKYWFIERAASGTAFDYFLIGLVGMLFLILVSLIVEYV